MSDAEILELATRNFRTATEGKTIPQYGRWEHWAGEMRKVIGSFTNTTDVLRYAQNDQNLPFTHRAKANPQRLSDYAMIIGGEYPSFIGTFKSMSEDARSLPDTMMHWTGGLISNMFLWHVWSLFTCRHYLPDPQSIIEIGGGYGAFARLWCLYFPVRRYVIVDLPESLFFAEASLRFLFGPEVGYFGDSDPCTKIVLVPVDKLGQWNSACDLVVNIGSMQEMTDKYIDYYMQWLDNSGAKYFYSLNYAAQPVNDVGESRCWWGPRPSPRWSTKLLQLDPAVIRAMCPTRRFLEAIYAREMSHNHFEAWRVFRGQKLTPRAFLEGLDLLRHDPNREDIILFMETVLNHQDELGSLPKEMVHLANLVECEASQRIKEYANTHRSILVQ
jgi:putative sugar O-methyltransferase